MFKRLIDIFVLDVIRYYYESIIEIIHEIKTGEHKFCDEIKQDRRG